MHARKIWKLLGHDRDASERLAQELKCSPVLAQLLLNRGLKDASACRRFLTAPLSGLHDPAALPGVREAADRLHRAIRDKRRICVYGDYDVDGISGTTLLWRCLQLAGGDAVFHVPHRLEEGYGLNSRTLEQLARDGCQVIVTVDCGITSIEEAHAARRLGLELIVTDHHLFRRDPRDPNGGPLLPDAEVVVHPKLPAGNYPFPELSGAGVAFKLAWAICQKVCQARKVSEAMRSFLLEGVALAALGTVADVVPLLDENRIFVRHGLQCLRESPSPGLRALLEAANLHGQELDAGSIGFQLAPRLNAAGRLGQARLAVELLAAESPQRAADLARYLNGQNEVRQSLERKIAHEARHMVEELGTLEESAALVLASPDWHPGVIGIVAGRLVERYARPVVLISLKETPAQGSGRAVDGFHLQEALNACSEHLLSHGGHAAAAGFRIAPEQVDAFREAFVAQAAAQLHGRAFRQTLLIDAEAPLSAMTLGLVRGIAYLHPHGPGNRRPLFLAAGLQVVGEPRKVGQGQHHLQFLVRQQQGAAFKAIAFGMAERAEELMSAGGDCCLVFAPKRNDWQGRSSIDLEVVDFQPGSSADWE